MRSATEDESCFPMQSSAEDSSKRTLHTECVINSGETSVDYCFISQG
jgi:hypothetical protein